MPHPHGPELPSAGVYARGYEAPGEVCFWKEWSEDRVGDTSLVKPKLVFSVLAGLFISLLNPLSKIESRRPLDGSFGKIFLSVVLQSPMGEEFSHVLRESGKNS